MSENISPDDLAAAIAKELMEYADDVTEGVFEAVDEAANACNKEIKQHLSKGHGVDTGKYRKAFRLKTTEQTKYNKEKTWYVKSPEHRLTHLLENGHVLRDKEGRVYGRSPAIKHIAAGEQIAKKVMQEMSEKAVTNAGR